MSFILDSQLECYGRHPAIRLSDQRRAVRLDLLRSTDSIDAEVWLRHDTDWYTVRVPLSPTTGKRLMVRWLTDSLEVLIDEFQPWGPATSVRVPLVRGSSQGSDRMGIRMGGPSEEHPGESYRGRLGEIAFWSRALDGDTLEKLRASSRPASPDAVPSFSPGALDDEGRELLLSDYDQLVKWRESGRLDHGDVRSACALAHVWLTDRYPLLQRASDHYGAMLSLPDLSRTEALTTSVVSSAPNLWWPEHEPAGDWVPLRAFQDDLACWMGTEGRTITWGQFIAFVRNKMGVGHYDPDDRKRWQRELAALARQTTVAGEPWLGVMMLTLVRSLSYAAYGTGIVSLAKND